MSILSHCQTCLFFICFYFTLNPNSEPRPSNSLSMFKSSSTLTPIIKKWRPYLVFITSRLIRCIWWKSCWQDLGEMQAISKYAIGPLCAAKVQATPLLTWLKSVNLVFTGKLHVIHHDCVKLRDDYFLAKAYKLPVWLKSEIPTSYNNSIILISKQKTIVK